MMEAVLALYIWEKEWGMPDVCISASASKRKTTKTHPNKNTWGRQFSGMHLREGNSICTDPPQPPFIYHIRAQVCWTSSNSLVFEVQIFEIRATCVHLVYFALLITVIFKKCFLYARSLTVYFSPPLPCPFLPQPLVSLVPVVYCSLMCCNC